MNTTVLLETMAGKGSEVGKTFEELREIIDRVKYNRDRIGHQADHRFEGRKEHIGDNADPTGADNATRTILHYVMII